MRTSTLVENIPIWKTIVVMAIICLATSTSAQTIAQVGNSFWIETDSFEIHYVLDPGGNGHVQMTLVGDTFQTVHGQIQVTPGGCQGGKPLADLRTIFSEMSGDRDLLLDWFAVYPMIARTLLPLLDGCNIAYPEPAMPNRAGCCQCGSSTGPVKALFEVDLASNLCRTLRGGSHIDCTGHDWNDCSDSRSCVKKCQVECEADDVTLSCNQVLAPDPNP